MIELFEDITYELTEYEKTLVPGFVAGLSKRIGKERAITSTEIIKKMPGMTGPRVRKIINYCITNYLIKGLIGTSKGYYISQDISEIKEAINGLGHREAAIQTRRVRLEEYLKSIL